MGFDEGVVRRLFGRTALESVKMPQVLRAYEEECGVPMMAPELLHQVEAFASENAHLDIDCDAFIAMVRALHDTADSDVSDTDDLLDNSLCTDADPASPDTTFESVSHEAPKTKGLPRTAFSERDIASMRGEDERRSVLIRKLAQVNDVLERLQSEHDAVIATKDEQATAKQALERQCASLQRDLQKAHAHDQASTARAAELTTCLSEVQAQCQTHKRRIERVQAELAVKQHVAVALEHQLEEQGKEMTQLREQVNAAQADAATLQDTCLAQRTAIAKLEDTIDTLEKSLAAVEQLQSEYAAFHAMHAELENEVAALRREESTWSLAWELPTRRARSQSAPPLTRWQRRDESEKEPMEMTSGEMPRPPVLATAQDVVLATTNERAGLDSTQKAGPTATLSPASRHVLVASLLRRSLPVGLVLLGVWLGIWLYFLVLRRTAMSLTHWSEVNRLPDPLVFPGLSDGWFAVHSDVYYS